VIAAGQSASGVIAADGAGVYWTSLHDGTVMRVPAVGGPPVILASGQVSPANLAIDGANVFWTASYSTSQIPGPSYGVTLWRAPLGGGTGVMFPTATSSLFAPAGVAVDAANLYWTNGDGMLSQMPVGGGDVMTLNPGGDGAALGDLAIDKTSVYWATPSDRTISKVPIGGGPVVTLATGQNGIARIAVDSTSIY
jgi:hypothetical protein